MRQKASVDSLKGEIKERKKTKDEREEKNVWGDGQGCVLNGKWKKYMIKNRTGRKNRANKKEKDGGRGVKFELWNENQKIKNKLRFKTKHKKHKSLK